MKTFAFVLVEIIHSDNFQVLSLTAEQLLKQWSGGVVVVLHPELGKGAQAGLVM